MVVKVSDLRTRVTKSQYTLFFEILYSAMRGLGFYGPPAQQTVSSAVLTTEAERLPHASPVATAVSAVAAQTPFSATSAYSEASVHSSLDELAAATSYTSLSVNAKVTTDILVEIPTVSLEILTQRVIPEQAGSIGSESSLAKFIASRFVYKTCSYEDGASDSEYQLNSLRIVDTRMECENVYRDILSPVHGSDNNILSCLVNRESLNGPTSYFVTIDSPKFILVLDHYFAVNEFFFGKVAAKSADQSPESTKAASAALPVGLNDDDRGDGLLPSPESAMVEEEVRAQDWNYRVNVVDLEVIVLQNPTNVSTEAIILTSKQLVVAYDVITSFSSHNLGMFFCSMDQRTETTLRFIQNFDLALTWESQETSPGHLLTNVMIDVTPLMLRMSYRDVLLILDIMKQFTDLSAAAGKDKDKPVNGNQAGSPSNTATIKPGIAMARERVIFLDINIQRLYINFLTKIVLKLASTLHSRSASHSD